MQTVASTDPWSVSEAGYPADGSPLEQLRHVVGYAVLAPSAHNTQPWRFRVTEAGIELHADRTRALGVSDPDGRELAISCGAALFHLRVALRRFGHMDRVHLYPDPKKPDLLALVSRGDEVRASREVLTLFRAIRERRTHRPAFQERDLGAPDLALLREAAEDEGGWMRPLAGTLRTDSARDLVDTAAGEISREIFVNEDVYEEEKARIFSRAWLYVGHESQIKNPGDYFVSKMGAESVILTRDLDGKIHVFLNSCAHRGMRVCRYDEGNTKVFRCPYHSWTYKTDGTLIGVQDYEKAYQPPFDKSKWGLTEVAQLANYMGTIWATWDKRRAVVRGVPRRRTLWSRPRALCLGRRRRRHGASGQRAKVEGARATGNSSQRISPAIGCMA